MREDATAKLLIDNDRTRVTEWRFAPGAHTGWHRHEMDYVVVPMITGGLDIELPGGSVVRSELQQGEPYYRDAGVEHDVINGNDFEFCFIEIEIK